MYYLQDYTEGRKTALDGIMTDVESSKVLSVNCFWSWTK